MSSTLRLGSGASVRMSGGVWTVVGLEGSVVHLRSGLESCVWLTADLLNQPDFAVLRDSTGKEHADESAQFAESAGLDTLPASEWEGVRRRLDYVLL